MLGHAKRRRHYPGFVSPVAAAALNSRTAFLWSIVSPPTIVRRRASSWATAKCCFDASERHQKRQAFSRPGTRVQIGGVEHECFARSEKIVDTYRTCEVVVIFDCVGKHTRNHFHISHTICAKMLAMFHPMHIPHQVQSALRPYPLTEMFIQTIDE